MTVSIDALYEQVTEAILRAEKIDAQGPSYEASKAHLIVSFLEEEIAEQFPVSEEEGAIARRGAVRAALAAGVHARAKDLADGYVAEPGAPPELIDELRRLGAVAEEALDLPALTRIPVVPAARYHVHPAAA
jgi:hypothetical protein